MLCFTILPVNKVPVKIWLNDGKFTASHVDARKLDYLVE